MKNNIFNFYRKKQPENTPKAERTTRTKKVHITRKTSTFAKLALTTRQKTGCACDLLTAGAEIQTQIQQRCLKSGWS